MRACELDVAVRKPGNVSRVSPGHGMQWGLFSASARASAEPLFRTGARVGERIEAAVAATSAAVGCNTNLGILLLCAPVARAIELQPEIQGPVALRAAMALAAERDSIARQYRDGYAELFELGLPPLTGVWVSDSVSPEELPPSTLTAAVQCVYLTFLAHRPDSHIVRKHGAIVAHSVMHSAQAWHARASAGANLDADPDFAAWDLELKAAGLNPGTSADFTVAALFFAGVLVH